MKIRTTLTLAAATLTLGVPVAAADPDGYQPGGQPDAIDRFLVNNGPDSFQPQLQSSAQPDAVDRYLANTLRQDDQPDAIARYLRNHPSGAESALGSTRAAGHPDSRAVRPGVIFPLDRAEDVGSSWKIGLGALGGVLIVLLAVVGASTMRERRRLVLR